MRLAALSQFASRLLCRLLGWLLCQPSRTSTRGSSHPASSRAHQRAHSCDQTPRKPGCHPMPPSFDAESCTGEHTPADATISVSSEPATTWNSPCEGALGLGLPTLSLIRAENENEVSCLELQLSSERTIFQKRQCDRELESQAHTGADPASSKAGTASALASSQQQLSWQWHMGFFRGAQPSVGPCTGSTSAELPARTEEDASCGGNDRFGPLQVSREAPASLAVPIGIGLMQRLGGLGDMLAQSPLGQVCRQLGRFCLCFPSRGDEVFSCSVL